MSYNTAAKLVMAIAFAVIFSSNSNAQMKYNPSPKGENHRQHEQQDKQVNQNFIDTFNSIQRRKRAAADQQKRQAEQRRQAEINRLRILGFNGGFARPRVSSGGGSTFGSSAFGPAMTRPVPRSSAQVRPVNPKTQSVVTAPPKVVKNPFFEANDLENGTQYSSVFESQDSPSPGVKTIGIQSNPLFNPTAEHESIPSIVKPVPVMQGSVIEIQSEETSILKAKKTGHSKEISLPNQIDTPTPNWIPPASPPRSFELEQLPQVYGQSVYENGVYFPSW